MSSGPVQMAERLAAALRQGGTDLVFGVPVGGANLDVVGAVQAAGCRFVLTHTETAAAVMARVTGELTGRPGAAVVTRGPGAASAVNGAAQALLDRQPMLLITDCVTTADRARVSHQRLDQSVILGPATKASLRLGPHATQATATTAVALASAVRSGPAQMPNTFRILHRSSSQALLGLGRAQAKGGGVLDELVVLAGDQVPAGRR